MLRRLHVFQGRICLFFPLEIIVVPQLIFLRFSGLSTEMVRHPEIDNLSISPVQEIPIERERIKRKLPLQGLEDICNRENQRELLVHEILTDPTVEHIRWCEFSLRSQAAGVVVSIDLQARGRAQVHA